MTRLVTHTETSPLELKKEQIDDDAVWICRCGLSGDWPFCDGSHARTRDEQEGEVRTYHRDEPDGALEVEEGFPESTEEANPRPDPAE